MTEIDCWHCKDYRECSGLYEWFHYGQIRFCPYQCLWILTNSETLRAGRWPKEPYSSGSEGQRKIKTEGYFVKAVLILLEVEVRLKRTGTQGELLVTQVEDGRTLSTLSDGAMEVLMYVKGNRRKGLSFNAWKKQKRYRKMTTKR